MPKKSAAIFFRYLLKKTLEEGEQLNSVYLQQDLPSEDDLATLLDSEQMFGRVLEKGEGVLFVVNVSKSSTGMPYATSLTVEGIGSDAQDALLNSRVGYEDGALEDLSIKANEFFYEEVGNKFYSGISNSDGQPWRALDRGFLMKQADDGKWQLTTTSYGLQMNEERNKADRIYLSIKRSSDRVNLDQLSKLKSSQDYFKDVQARFKDELQSSGVLDSIEKSYQLRQEAAKALVEAKRNAEKAAKWARVASGFKIVADIAAAGSSIASSIQKSNMQKSANAMLGDAVSTAKANASQLAAVQGQVNDLGKQISDLQTSVLKDLPVPNYSIGIEVQIGIFDFGPPRDFPGGLP